MPYVPSPPMSYHDRQATRAKQNAEWEMKQGDGPDPQPPQGWNQRPPQGMQQGMHMQGQGGYH